MDTLIVRRDDGSVKLRVFRKKKHQSILQPLHHKMGVVRTLLDRCEGIVSEEGDREKERKTIKDALGDLWIPRMDMEISPRQTK